jgi:hypothetical protein
MTFKKNTVFKVLEELTISIFLIRKLASVPEFKGQA